MSISGPELVIGLIYPVGTYAKALRDAVKSSLARVDYTTQHIHVIDKLRELEPQQALSSFPTEDVRYNKLMDAGNEFRRKINSKDGLAMLSVAAIRNARDNRPASSNTRTAYILHSLKTPEEIKTLRKIYGPNFISIAAFSSEQNRIDRLADIIMHSHGSGHDEKFVAHARELVSRDKEESEETFGQNIRATYPLGDIFVNADQDLDQKVMRAIELFFGNFKHTSSREEYGMHLATNSSWRSTSLARQVGAAICAPQGGQILALGCNDVPKTGGGSYWEYDSPDYRDHTPNFGYDTNDRMKRHLVRDVLKRLKQNQWLSDQYTALGEQELARLAIQPEKGPLRNAMLMDITEYGRAVHAEMDAITDAARRGVSIQDAVLYTTTFPCHNCAKHIIAAGISRVIYIDPYPKSYALDMYKGFPFESFVGIAPRLYQRVFAMGSSIRKDADGDVVEWIPEASLPRIFDQEGTYIAREDSCINELKAKLDAANIKIAN